MPIMRLLLRDSKEVAVDKKLRIPIVDDPERLTKKAARLLSAAANRTICCEHVDDERIQDGISYWIEPGGRRADPDAVKELLRKHRIVPIRDGLFEGDTQSFRAA